MPGETVLDLGSGGGIDVLLSARRVGPTGKAYGLDMTDEMLALANENKRKAGVENVEFLKGEIENIPLPDNSVDVIISNCVINLSADKDKVLREAFRVLKPGGRFAVSDVVTRGEMLPEIRQSVLAWVGCIAGALEENEYRNKLAGSRIRTDRDRADADLSRRRRPRISFRAGNRRRRHRPAGGRKVPERLHPRRETERCQGSMLRPDLLQLNANARRINHADTLQRSISLHGKLGALHHGRGDPESQRASRTSPPIARAVIPTGNSASRSAPATRVGSPSDGRTSAARVGTNSRGPALLTSISSSPSVTTPPMKSARYGRASR